MYLPWTFHINGSYNPWPFVTVFLPLSIIPLLWTSLYKYLFENLFSILGMYLGVEFLGFMVILSLTFWGNTKLFSTVRACSVALSHVQLLVTPWIVACQDSLFMGLSRQEYWSRLPFPPPGDLPDSGIKPKSPELAGGFFTTEPPGKTLFSFLPFAFSGPGVTSNS